MTLSIAHTHERRRQSSELLSSFSEAAALIIHQFSAAQNWVWPSTTYQQDPVGFAKDVLGVEPWSRQEEILQALTVPYARVAVSSGHKIGKSTLAAMAAIWFYCSFPDARVVMSSVTDRQVNEILWREVKKLIARSGRCLSCRARDPHGFTRCRDCNEAKPIPEEPGGLARTGLHSPDFRELVGFTAKEPEAVAGISGANLFYILDEASGIPEEIFTAIDGNRAGGARILMISNPTRNDGRFFHAFHSGAEFWKTFTISSEESPNVVANKEIVPGLALRSWVDDMRNEWGEDSPNYRIRVLGKFVRNEERKVIQTGMYEDAQAGWEFMEANGRLNIGLDVARSDSKSSDESACAPRRGLKVLPVRAWRGLSAESLAAEVIQVVRELRRDGERAAVKVDSCGSMGLEAVAALKRYSREIDIFPVNVSDKPRVQGQYARLRDQLWFGMQKWLRDGGTLPDDKKLAQELCEPTFYENDYGLLCVEKKDKVSARLKRSPDRADAVILSVFEPGSQQIQSDDDDDYDDPFDDGPRNLPSARYSQVRPDYGGGIRPDYGRSSRGDS